MNNGKTFITLGARGKSVRVYTSLRKGMRRLYTMASVYDRDVISR